MQFTKEMLSAADELLGYLNDSPTAAHAVQSGCRILEKAAFREVQADEAWSLKSGDRFFHRAHGTALVAGIMGKGNLKETGFRIIGAHTDSPGFRIRQGGFFRQAGYSQAGVEIYGGPLLASWTDRDLGIAGRILFRNGSTTETRLWSSSGPLLRIPQLAIHLNRDVNDKGLVLNKHNETVPILCSLEDTELGEKELLTQIAGDFGRTADDIVGTSLELVDCQQAAIGGLHGDMIFSGRIDNLAMCSAALQAVTAVSETPDATALIVLFDSEEIGSSTLNGGASPLLNVTLERLMLQDGLNREEQFITLNRSRNFSADGAHAVHPNYTGSHDARHYCHLNGGPAIKINANQRYASNMETIAEIRELGRSLGIPLQTYYHRNDIPCGSTIGPITATATGIPTIDIGNPMLSMHSIRECSGTADQWMMETLMKHFMIS